MKRLLTFLLTVALLLSFASCQSQIAVQSETKEETETAEIKETVPSSTKKHKSLEEYENQTGYSAAYDGKNINPKTMPNKGIADLTVQVNALASTHRAENDGKILFYGHSHYTRWKTSYDNTDGTKMNLEDQLLSSSGEKVCINNGFGSSTMHDLAYNYDKLVKPWKPKVLVITSFANDYQYDVYEIIKFTDWLLNRATSDFPDMKIFITDYPPILKDRTGVMERITKLNQKLSECAAQYPNVTVIEMSKEQGFYKDAASVGTYTNVRPELYVADQTHFTPEGYRVVTEIYKKYLKDYLG